MAHDEATDAKKQKQSMLEENTRLQMQLQQMREEVAASRSKVTAHIEAHGVDNQINKLMTQLQVVHATHTSKLRVSFGHGVN